MEIAIGFSESGVASGFHTDKFDLGFLGNKSVRRQTHIVFRPEDQLWVIGYVEDDDTTTLLAEYYEAAAFQTYENAIKFEVEWLNACRVANVHPTGEDGLYIAGVLLGLLKLDHV